MIDLYLSGYNNAAEADTTAVPVETDDGAELAAEGLFTFTKLCGFIRKIK